MARRTEDETTAGGGRTSTRWQWLRRYRIWRANRKTFIYPENVLEPESREDKSALFEEAESGLGNAQIDQPAQADRSVKRSSE